MFCTKCGAKLPDGARFCAMCGAPAPMPETQSTPVAPASAPQPTSAPGSQPVAAATPAPVAAPVAAPAPAPVPAAASQPAPVAAGGLLNPFVQQVATRLGEPAQFIPELQTYLFVTKRFSAALANIHQYFLIYENNGVGYNEMRDDSAACTDCALHNDAGVPHGLHKGVAIYPVMLQHPMNPGAIQFVKEKPKAKFAAFTLPVVVDPIDRQVQFMDTTPVWGFAMWGGVKKAATEVLS